VNRPIRRTSLGSAVPQTHSQRPGAAKPSLLVNEPKIYPKQVVASKGKKVQHFVITAYFPPMHRTVKKPSQVSLSAYIT